MWDGDRERCGKRERNAERVREIKKESEKYIQKERERSVILY